MTQSLQEVNKAVVVRFNKRVIEALDEAVYREIFDPDFVNRTNGREACIAGYLDFCTQANITDFKLGEPGIDVFGNTAVATYSYEISYEMGGESFTDTGRDLFVFVREGDRWQAVWRTMIIPQEQTVN